MEEKEKINEKSAPEVHKYTYEQLEEFARKLIVENNKLKGAVAQLNDVRGLKRIEFLFKVVENAVEFGEETVQSAVNDIKDSLFEKAEPDVSNAIKTEDND